MRRILASLMIIGLVTGALAFATASFVDTETSEDNTVSTGSLDLQLMDNNEAFGDGVSESWVRLDVEPGDDLACENNIVATNVGSIAGGSMDITVYNDIIDPPGPESDTGDGTTTGLEMAAYVELSSLVYDGVELLPLIGDPLSDGVPGPSLADIENQGGFSGLPGLPPSPGGQSFGICFEFRSDAGNDFQGKTLLTDVIFTLQQ